MKGTSMRILWMMTLLTILSGCGRVRYPVYYTLNLPSPSDPPPSMQARTSLAVREFQSPAYLREGPIVYRSTPEQIGFYEYHRWATDPRAVVTGAVIDHLRADGRFSKVSAYHGSPDDDYIFSGKLEKLEEVDAASGVKVDVALSAEITCVKTGSTVWSSSILESGVVSERTVRGIVSQMDRTLDKAINELLATVPAP